MASDTDAREDGDAGVLQNLDEGDTVTVQLEGEVVDRMEEHDDVFRIDVEGQKVEILSEEIVDIERRFRPVGIKEVADELQEMLEGD